MATKKSPKPAEPDGKLLNDILGGKHVAVITKNSPEGPLIFGEKWPDISAGLEDGAVYEVTGDMLRAAEQVTPASEAAIVPSGISMRGEGAISIRVVGDDLEKLRAGDVGAVLIDGLEGRWVIERRTFAGAAGYFDMRLA